MADLENMILAKRDNAFGGFLNYMEDKYAEKPNKKRQLPKENNEKEVKNDKNEKKRKLN